MTDELPEQSGQAEQPSSPEQAIPSGQLSLPEQPGTESAQASVLAQPSTEDIDWRRLHPLSPLLRGGLVLLIITGIIIANFRDSLISLFVSQQFIDDSESRGQNLFEVIVENGLVFIVLLGVLGVLALVFFFSWLSWRVHTFRVTDAAVEERSGLLRRQHRRAPLDRIQSVNLQRPLLARALGMTAVDVQTGGQGGKVSLRYLGSQDAKEIRQRILAKVIEQRDPPTTARARGAAANFLADDAGGSATEASLSTTASQLPPPFPPAQNADGTVPAQWAAGYDPRLVQPSGAQAFLDGRVREITDFDIDADAENSGTLVQVPFKRLLASVVLSTEMLVLVVLIVATIVLSIIFEPYILLTSLPLAIVVFGLMIGQINKGYNFVLSRSRNGIRVGSGLTSTITETVPFGRIHAVEARQPIGWRPLGWWKMRITTAGHSLSQGGQNSLQNTVLPVGRIEDAVRVFETLLPGEVTEASTAELRNALAGQVEGYLTPGRRAGLVLWFGRRRAGIKLEEGENATLRVRRGGLTRFFAVLPIVRAQSVQLRRPLVHRMLGLASIDAHTVLGPVRLERRGLAWEDAREFFARLSRAVVAAQLAEADHESEQREAVQRGVVPQEVVAQEGPLQEGTVRERAAQEGVAQESAIQQNTAQHDVAQEGRHD